MGGGLGAVALSVRGCLAQGATDHFSNPERCKARADLSAAQIAMARQLGLTPVTGVGEHAELTATAGARSLGLTPTAGVTTIHICPSCAVKIYNMGGWLTVARHFAFGR
jgi:hypothetical protein